MNTLQKMLLRPGLALPPSHAAVEAGLDPLLPDPLPLRDAIRIKSAEFWLVLGCPELASRELERVAPQADRHPWTLRVQMLVWSALTLD